MLLCFRNVKSDTEEGWTSSAKEVIALQKIHQGKLGSAATFTWIANLMHSILPAFLPSLLPALLPIVFSLIAVRNLLCLEDSIFAI
jgi:hypothetical protein